MKILLVYQDNWADEIDFESYCIMDVTEWEALKAKMFAEEAAGDRDGVSVCFGTNEDNEYDSVEDLLEHVDERPITDAEAEVLERLLGKQFGCPGYFVGD